MTVQTTMPPFSVCLCLFYVWIAKHFLCYQNDQAQDYAIIPRKWWVLADLYCLMTCKPVLSCDSNLTSHLIIVISDFCRKKTLLFESSDLFQRVTSNHQSLSCNNKPSYFWGPEMRSDEEQWRKPYMLITQSAIQYLAECLNGVGHDYI